MGKSMPFFTPTVVAALSFCAACEQRSFDRTQPQTAPRHVRIAEESAPPVDGAQNWCDTQTAPERMSRAAMRNTSTERLRVINGYYEMCQFDRQRILEILDVLIERGDAGAMRSKAVLLMYDGDPSNDGEVERLFERAAELGDEPSRHELGVRRAPQP